MARQRQRQIKEIEVHRNVIENFLMDAQDFLKNNRKIVLYVIIGVFVTITLTISGFIIIENLTESNNIKFEAIMDKYEEFQKNPDSNNEITINKVITELEEFVDSTYFGFSHEIGYYILGNIYFSEKMYKKALESFLKFSEVSSSSLFVPIALVKGGIASEEMNDLDGALKIYNDLIENYQDNFINEEIYYNLACVYSKKNDITNSRKYFNKVISVYPQSQYAKKAKKRLMLLGNK